MATTRLMIGWTTLESRDDALRLARDLVEAKLAACAQISGPITSVYRWEGTVEQSEEFRLTVKFREDRGAALEAWLTQHHPYDAPQWVACVLDEVSEKYLKWATDDST